VSISCSLTSDHSSWLFELATKKLFSLRIIATKITHFCDRPCLSVHSWGSSLRNLRNPETVIHGIPHTERHHITVPDTIILDAERGARDRDTPRNVTLTTAMIMTEMTEETRTPETDKVTAKQSPNLDTRERRIESASPMKTTAKDTGGMLIGKWRTRGTGEVLIGATTTIGTGDSQKGEWRMEGIGALPSQELFTYRQGRLDRRCRIEWTVIPDAARSMPVSKSHGEVPRMSRERKAQIEGLSLDVLASPLQQVINIPINLWRIQLQGDSPRARLGHPKTRLTGQSQVANALTCATRIIRIRPITGSTGRGIVNQRARPPWRKTIPPLHPFTEGTLLLPLQTLTKADWPESRGLRPNGLCSLGQGWTDYLRRGRCACSAKRTGSQKIWTKTWHERSLSRISA
jgi:hypothetical protein